MKFPSSKPRASQDRAIVPMINVIFLLLIFFLMSATLSPPEPFDITPPNADGPQTDTQPGTLYISATGELAFDAARDDAVWSALQAHIGPLPIRVDASWPAADLAALLPRLSEVGITDIRLLTVAP
ncbi:MAG: biopolymer transporter ExbD [Roseicyclus sp.]|nr:biopolymer transporter ExbD [Roseicyclus sp.]